METLFKKKRTNRISVKISAKCMNTLFVKCDAYYVRNHCKGICCRNSKGKLNVIISPRESHYIESLGGIIEGGKLQPKIDETWCPFQKQNGLCIIHKKSPIGCIVSPFNLNANNTVIIRYRNLCMNCHKEGTIAAYKVFENSLRVMFGKREANRICLYLDNNAGDLQANMFRDVWEDLTYNRNMRKTIKK